MDTLDTYSVSFEFCLGRWTFVEFYAWKNILTHWITVILSEKLLGESEVCAIYLTAQNKNHNYEYVVYFEIIKKNTSHVVISYLKSNFVWINKNIIRYV